MSLPSEQLQLPFVPPDDARYGFQTQRQMFRIEVVFVSYQWLWSAPVGNKTADTHQTLLMQIKATRNDAHLLVRRRRCSRKYRGRQSCGYNGDVSVIQYLGKEPRGISSRCWLAISPGCRAR